jgi:hypothetical protein
MGRTAARGEWGVHPPRTIDRAAGCSACGAVGRRAAGRGVRLRIDSNPDTSVIPVPLSFGKQR